MPKKIGRPKHRKTLALEAKEQAWQKERECFNSMLTEAGKREVALKAENRKLHNVLSVLSFRITMLAPELLLSSKHSEAQLVHALTRQR